MTPKCSYPLILHRVRAGGDVMADVYECPDPDCAAIPGDHDLGHRIPCRWSWPYAHGKKETGRSFPVRRCGDCYHIRRVGNQGKLAEEG